MSYLNCKWWKR